MRQRKPTVYAASWKRALAFVLDALLVTKVLWPLLVWLFPATAVFTPWGKYVLGALYFGFWDSFYMEGASPGKRLLAIQVRGTDRKLLRPTQAVGRFLMLVSPAVAATLLNVFWPEAGLKGEEAAQTFSFAFLSFSLGGCWLAGLIFLLLHPQRRSLHDIFSATVVVAPDRFFEPPLDFGYRPGIAALLVYLFVAWQGWKWVNQFSGPLEKLAAGRSPAQKLLVKPAGVTR
jgi:uncharacterized RDD family membrane protein YckC